MNLFSYYKIKIKYFFLKIVNTIKVLYLLIFKKPLFCWCEQCLDSDIFSCSICNRILPECDRNSAIIEESDSYICCDCFENKYREEILMLQGDLDNYLIERLKEI